LFHRTPLPAFVSEPGLPDIRMTLSTMWPLADTALHLIDEANLVSARRYGIELDLESSLLPSYSANQR
jgi:hypothetical protein